MQVVLWILILLLLLLVCFLFSLCCYMIEGAFEDTKRVKAKITWLCNMFRVDIQYSDTVISGVVRIFFWKKTFTEDLTKSEAENVKEEAQKETVKEEKRILFKIKDKIRKIRNLYPKIKKMVMDENNQKAIRHIKDEILLLLKCVFPKKTKVDGAFSVGAPDATGKAFGVLACFPILYEKDWKLLPDFESDERYFRGTVFAKGHFCIYQILLCVIRILFDKNCRRLYTIIRLFIKKADQVERAEEK